MAQLHGGKVAVQQPQQAGEGHHAELIEEIPGRQRRGGNPRRDIALGHEVDLHGLAAGGRGGDVGVKHACKGEMGSRGQLDPVALHPQECKQARTLRIHITGVAQRRRQQPEGIQREQHVPCVGQLLIGEGDIQHYTQRDQDHHATDDLAPFTLIQCAFRSLRAPVEITGTPSA